MSVMMVWSRAMEGRAASWTRHENEHELRNHNRDLGRTKFSGWISAVETVILHDALHRFGVDLISIVK